MKKIAFLICLLSAHQAYAQQQEKPTNECHFYKWTENGEAQYGRAPARGHQGKATCFAYFNGYNYEVDPNGFDPNAVAIIRPSITAPNPHQAPGAEQAPIPGTISRVERCNTLKGELRTLTEKSIVYEEDRAGNLIPLSKEQVEARKAQAQSQIDAICNAPANNNTSAPAPAPSAPAPQPPMPQTDGPVPLR